MTYVVTDACIKCKYMDCVEVCPVDCFYEGEGCSSSTPTNASIAACASPNARPKRSFPTPKAGSKNGSSSIPFLCRWPNITRKKDSPADADEHKGEEGKYDKYFTPDPGAGD